MMDEEHDGYAEGDAARRAYHSAQERLRRESLKMSFADLRDAVPFLQGTKVSRVQTLNAATNYIQYMRRRNTAHRRDIADIKRENELLGKQIRILEEMKASGGRRSPKAPHGDPADTEGASAPAFESGSASKGPADIENSPEGAQKENSEPEPTQADVQ
ncbi:protein max-like [Haemaphysalis longicornis]